MSFRANHKDRDGADVAITLAIDIKEYDSKIEAVDNMIVAKQSKLAAAIIAEDKEAYTSIRNEIATLKATRTKYEKNIALLRESIDRNT